MTVRYINTTPDCLSLSNKDGIARDAMPREDIIQVNKDGGVTFSRAFTFEHGDFVVVTPKVGEAIEKWNKSQVTANCLGVYMSFLSVRQDTKTNLYYFWSHHPYHYWDARQPLSTVAKC